MTFDYSASLATATRLIAKFGKSCTLRQVSESGPEYNPTYTNTDTTITAVDLNQRKIGGEGGSVVETVRTLLVSAASTAPAKGDRVQVSGTWHTITEARPLSPGNTTLLYECEVSS